jgi:hypothetical protein
VGAERCLRRSGRLRWPPDQYRDRHSDRGRNRRNSQFCTSASYANTFSLALKIAEPFAEQGKARVSERRTRRQRRAGLIAAGVPVALAGGDYNVGPQALLARTGAADAGRYQRP